MKQPPERAQDLQRRDFLYGEAAAWSVLVSLVQPCDACCGHVGKSCMQVLFPEQQENRKKFILRLSAFQYLSSASDQQNLTGNVVCQVPVSLSRTVGQIWNQGGKKLNT